jgi:hypothetical protein
MDKRRIVASGLAVLLIGLAVWTCGLFVGSDPAVAELSALRDQMFDRDLPDVDRQRLRDQFRQRIESLSNDQRRALFAGGREMWMQRAEQRMDAFFAMSAEGQRQQLDEMLSRMAARRQERGKSPNAGGPRRQGTTGGSGSSRGNRAGMTEAQRDERAKRRLDRTSPKMRAQFAEFRRRLTQRAERRGINAGELRGRRGGWGASS